MPFAAWIEFGEILWKFLKFRKGLWGNGFGQRVNALCRPKMADPNFSQQALALVPTRSLCVRMSPYVAPLNLVEENRFQSFKLLDAVGGSVTVKVIFFAIS